MRLPVQVGTDAVMIQWQQCARESLVELLCTNLPFEKIPLCYGSCQLPDLYSDLTEDSGADEIGSVSAPTILTACLPVTLPALPVRLAAPPVARRQLCPTVPNRLDGDFRRSPLLPPLA